LPELGFCDKESTYTGAKIEENQQAFFRFITLFRRNRGEIWASRFEADGLCFVVAGGGGEFGVVGTTDRANTGSAGTGSGDQNSSAARFVIEWDGSHHTSRFGYVKMGGVELSTVYMGGT
jgi:hypothetical protein